MGCSIIRRRPSARDEFFGTRTHPEKIQAIARQLIDRRSPLQSATPTVAPVMHI